MRGVVPNPSTQAAHFGTALAAADDGVLVGAPFEGGPAGDAVGTVYLVSDGTTVRRFDNPEPVAGDQFGVTFRQPVSGLKSFICCSRAVVEGPRSFSYTTPS